MCPGKLPRRSALGADQLLVRNAVVIVGLQTVYMRRRLTTLVGRSNNVVRMRTRNLATLNDHLALTDARNSINTRVWVLLFALVNLI